MVSCIGDEWAIYERAKGIALGKLSLIREIFDPLSMGMWGVHKPFLTFCQGIGLWVFGINNFGWRMASIASFALSVPALFIVARSLMSARSALLATALMASSYFLLAESLWGYGWTLLRFVALWEAASLAIFLIRPAAWSAAFLGLMMSLCSLSGALCSYIPALTVVILIGFCLIRKEKRIFKVSGLVVLVYILTNTVPIHIWSHTDDLKTTLQLTLAKTNLGPLLQKHFGTEIFPKVEGSATTIPDFIKLFGLRFGQTVIAPVTYEGSSHYVFGRLNDPVMAVLSLIGLVCAAFFAIRSWRWRLVLAFYIPAVILAGALSPYPQPAITRIHFLVPFWALFAALACDTIGKRLPATVTNLLFVGLFVFSAAWSYDRLFVKLPKTIKFTKQAYGIELLQALPEKRLAFLFTDWHPLDFVLEPYGVKDRVIMGKPQASQEILESIANDPSVLVVLPPEVRPETISMVRARMCSQRSDADCDCRPCGGLQPHPLFVCGSFTCPRLESESN
jgi:hypothetical protein